MGVKTSAPSKGSTSSQSHARNGSTDKDSGAALRPRGSTDTDGKQAPNVLSAGSIGTAASRNSSTSDRNAPISDSAGIGKSRRESGGPTDAGSTSSTQRAARTVNPLTPQAHAAADGNAFSAQERKLSTAASPAPEADGGTNVEVKTKAGAGSSIVVAPPLKPTSPKAPHPPRDAAGAHSSVSSPSVSVSSPSARENTAPSAIAEQPPLTRHGAAIAARVNGIFERCRHYEKQAMVGPLPLASPDNGNRAPLDPPTEDEMLMYEILVSLLECPVGQLVVFHPEVALSNRFCVMTTPDLRNDETVASYGLCGVYNPGTIGRSYFATRAGVSVEEGRRAAAAADGLKGSKANGPPRSTSPVSASFSLAEAKARKSAVTERDSNNFSVLKMVSFFLRKELLDDVLAEQRVLVSIPNDNVLKVTDVLNDEFRENVIIITNFHPRGGLVPYSGHLDEEPEKFRRISLEVGVGLRFLHSHKIYHHNLKLENIIETSSGHYCISDAGFSQLFTSQCPEALVFNGELAALPPEVFDASGPYASKPGTWVPPKGDGTIARSNRGSPIAAAAARRSPVSGGEVSNPEKIAEPAPAAAARDSFVPLVDVWGYGVLLYRLAFGRDPFEIAECVYAEVRKLVTHQEPSFPPKPTWPFYNELVAVIKACLHKNPLKRPKMAEVLQMPYFKDLASSGHAAPRSVTLNTVHGPSHGSSTGTRPASSGGRGRDQHRNGYTVDAGLGRGRVSETLLVHLRRNSTKQYAFKMISKSVLKRLQASTPGKLSKGKKEAQVREILRCLAVSRRMNHPSIIPYIDIVDGKSGGCFVVQEYMRNGPMQAMPPLSSPNGKSPDLERLLSDVLLGLVHLHDNNVAHLCLTPSNIFLNESTGHYRFADFGPLFLTIEEIVQSESEGKPIYSLPGWILTETPVNPFHVDTFFVGLLAASIVPTLFPQVWSQLKCTKGSDALSVDAILKRVRSPSERLPNKLVDFIREALCRGKTARELLQHAYFNGKYAAKNIPVDKINVTATEIEQAVLPKPETRDESRLADVLGQDPFLESQVLSSVAGDCDTSFSAVDKSLIVLFKGSNLRCGQCRAEIKVALYRCNICTDVVRCGKCSVIDNHHEGHTLAPFVIHTIEYSKDGTSRAILCHPSTIQDVHALETLEMRANFPVGALSGHVVSQKQMERSLARSFAGVNASQRLPGGGADASGGNHLADVEASISAIGGPSAAMIKTINTSVTNFTFGAHSSNNNNNNTNLGNNASASGVGDSVSFTSGANPSGAAGNLSAAFGNLRSSGNASSAAAASSSSTVASGMSGPTASSSNNNTNNNTASSGGNLGNNSGTQRNLLKPNQPPQPPPMGKAGLLKNSSQTKKLVLPKAEDLDDLPWEDELRQCRERDLTELLLFNYGFTQVPPEVYTPPPVQVVLLDLSQNSLTSLPQELSLLAHLRKLIVSYNKLTELPDSLGNLMELESIDASHNALVDLPMTFIYLSNLQSCAMDYNDFSCIPESILGILPPGGGEGASALNRTMTTSTARNISEDGETVMDDGTATPTDGPVLSVIYLAANDRITTLPDIAKLKRFPSLKIALDNEPSLYRAYMDQGLEAALPNVSVAWNKIYPDEIIKNLYCGSLRSAQSQMVYRKLKIGYVLTVGRGLTPVPPEGGKHKTIIVDDIPGADILSMLTEAIEFIEESQKANSGCLVHCFAGLSRSATTVIAYLMVKKQMRMDEAYLLAKKGRPAILPNDGFFGQLINLDAQLYPKAKRALNLASLDRPTDEKALNQKDG